MDIWGAAQQGLMHPSNGTLDPSPSSVHHYSLLNDNLKAKIHPWFTKFWKIRAKIHSRFTSHRILICEDSPMVNKWISAIKCYSRKTLTVLKDSCGKVYKPFSAVCDRTTYVVQYIRYCHSGFLNSIHPSNFTKSEKISPNAQFSMITTAKMRTN